MSEPSKFESIGELVRDQVDPALDTDAHRVNRLRFVDAAHGSKKVRAGHLNRWLALAAVSAVLLLVVGSWHFTRGPEILRFTVGVEASEGKVGTYIAPIASQPLPVHFSDGSKIHVHPAARVRVAETTARGASISLESGRVDLEVNKAEGAWSVVAGPYRVRVTGTKFDVSWKPEEGHAEVRVKEGMVVVTGPSVETGVEVSAGEHFSSRSLVTVKPAVSSSGVVMSDTPESIPSTAGLEPSEQLRPAVDDALAEPSSSEDARVEKLPPPTWNELAAQGKYDDIVRQAEAKGVETVLSTGSASELHALSQAARFTGKAGLGNRCLLQLRARHPASSQARSAAFVLGRTADQAGQSASALQWYDTYLSESPGGSLAAEAQGRRMVLLQRMGRTAEAQSAARTYLDRYPKGGYAAVAKDVLGQ